MIDNHWKPPIVRPQIITFGVGQDCVNQYAVKSEPSNQAQDCQEAQNRDHSNSQEPGKQLIDSHLKENIRKVVLQNPQGIEFGKFAGVFHQIHGIQLCLTKYGYKSLLSLLEDLPDIVMIDNDLQPPIVRPQIITFGVDQDSVNQSPVKSELPNQAQDCQEAQNRDHNNSQEPGKRRIDSHLKENIRKVVLQNPQGIEFGNFAGVFHQIHGIQLCLTKYGYKSLLSLLEDLPDIVMIDNDLQPPIVRPQIITFGVDQDSVNQCPVKSELPNQVQDCQEAQNRDHNNSQEPVLQVQDWLQAQISFQNNTTERNVPSLEDDMAVKCALKETILNVVLQYPKGIILNEFPAAFSQISGKRLDLSKYGYKSLESLLQGLSDVVHVDYSNSPPLVKLQQWVKEDKFYSPLESNPQKQNCQQEKQQEEFSALPNWTFKPICQVPPAIEMTLASILHRFPAGLKMKKLAKEFKDIYEQDLKEVAQMLRYGEPMNLLKHLPGIYFCSETKTENCKVLLKEEWKPSSPAAVIPAACDVSLASAKEQQPLIPDKFLNASNCGISQEAYTALSKGTKNSDPDNCYVAAKLNTPSLEPAVPAKKLWSEILFGSTVTTDRAANPSVCCTPRNPMTSATTSQSMFVLNSTESKDQHPSVSDTEKQTVTHTVCLSELKQNIVCIVKNHPSGMSLFELRNEYFSLFSHHLPLNGYPTVNHLLNSMRDIIKIEGVGVNMMIYPLSCKPTPLTVSDMDSAKAVAPQKPGVALTAVQHISAPKKEVKAARLQSTQELDPQHPKMTGSHNATQHFVDATSTQESLKDRSVVMPQQANTSFASPEVCTPSVTPRIPCSSRGKVAGVSSSQNATTANSTAGVTPHPYVLAAKAGQHSPAVKHSALSELKQNISHIMKQHPDGLTVFKFKNVYASQFKCHIPLDGYSSINHLLNDMSDVSLEGIGAQTVVYPASSKPNPQIAIFDDSGIRLVNLREENSEAEPQMTTATVSAVQQPPDPEALLHNPHTETSQKDFPQQSKVAGSHNSAPHSVTATSASLVSDHTVPIMQEVPEELLAPWITANPVVNPHSPTSEVSHHPSVSVSDKDQYCLTNKRLTLSEIKQNVAFIVQQNPDGVPVSELKNVYTSHFKHNLPMSVNLLLKAMKDTIRTEEIREQTMLFPLSYEQNLPITVPDDLGIRLVNLREENSEAEPQMTTATVSAVQQPPDPEALLHNPHTETSQKDFPQQSKVAGSHNSAPHSVTATSASLVSDHTVPIMQEVPEELLAPWITANPVVNPHSPTSEVSHHPSVSVSDKDQYCLTNKHLTLSEIKQNVAFIVQQNPDGVPVSELKNVYTSHFKHNLPMNVNLLLKAMKDTIRTEEIREQTMLFPLSYEQNLPITVPDDLGTKLNSSNEGSSVDVPQMHTTVPDVQQPQTLKNQMCNQHPMVLSPQHTSMASSHNPIFHSFANPSMPLFVQHAVPIMHQRPLSLFGPPIIWTPVVNPYISFLAQRTATAIPTTPVASSQPIEPQHISVSASDKRQTSLPDKLLTLSELKENVSFVVQQNPGGIPLSELRNAYVSHFKHQLPLDNLYIVNHLLKPMKDLIRMEEIGEQTVLFPASSKPNPQVVVQCDFESKLTRSKEEKSAVTRSKEEEKSAVPQMPINSAVHQPPTPDKVILNPQAEISQDLCPQYSQETGSQSQTQDALCATTEVSQDTTPIMQWMPHKLPNSPDSSTPWETQCSSPTPQATVSAVPSGESTMSVRRAASETQYHSFTVPDEQEQSVTAKVSTSSDLKQNITYIVEQHPEGLSLFKVRNAYASHFKHHIPLDGYSSISHLLSDMSDIVSLKGIGAQTMVYPAKSKPNSHVQNDSESKLTRSKEEEKSAVTRSKEEEKSAVPQMPISSAVHQPPIPEKVILSPQAEISQDLYPQYSQETGTQNQTQDALCATTELSQDTTPIMQWMPHKLPNSPDSSTPWETHCSSPTPQAAVSAVPSGESTMSVSSAASETQYYSVTVPDEQEQSVTAKVSTSSDLKQNIAYIVEQHPEGLSLFKLQDAYTSQFKHHIPLDGYSSINHLLNDMSDIVSMEGLGAQTVIYPAKSIPNPHVMLHDDSGFSSLAAKNTSHLLEQSTAGELEIPFQPIKVKKHRKKHKVTLTTEGEPVKVKKHRKKHKVNLQDLLSKYSADVTTSPKDFSSVLLTESCALPLPTDIKCLEGDSVNSETTTKTTLSDSVKFTIPASVSAPYSTTAKSSTTCNVAITTCQTNMKLPSSPVTHPFPNQNSNPHLHVPVSHAMLRSQLSTYLHCSPVYTVPNKPTQTYVSSVMTSAVNPSRFVPNLPITSPFIVPCPVSSVMSHPKSLVFPVSATDAVIGKNAYAKHVSNSNSALVINHMPSLMDSSPEHNPTLTTSETSEVKFKPMYTHPYPTKIHDSSTFKSTYPSELEPNPTVPASETFEIQSCPTFTSSNALELESISSFTNSGTSEISSSATAANSETLKTQSSTLHTDPKTSQVPAVINSAAETQGKALLNNSVACYFYPSYLPHTTVSESSLTTCSLKYSGTVSTTQKLNKSDALAREDAEPLKSSCVTSCILDQHNLVPSVADQHITDANMTTKIPKPDMKHVIFKTDETQEYAIFPRKQNTECTTNSDLSHIKLASQTVAECSTSLQKTKSDSDARNSREENKSGFESLSPTITFAEYPVRNSQQVHRAVQTVLPSPRQAVVDVEHSYQSQTRTFQHLPQQPQQRAVLLKDTHKVLPGMHSVTSESSFSSFTTNVVTSRGYDMKHQEFSGLPRYPSYFIQNESHGHFSDHSHSSLHVTEPLTPQKKKKNSCVLL
ncbi:uncharacterized protein LOC122809657 isoform X2 [Protopterus annectens]|uniref:uncharacterized protein LOC122809657 isoform X2 n=1 Tax=Protopterus annectens TaxID=7888 RepID=UPI001CFC35FD|nr:uncharacterized protein LOC122809657 isoform X2 [Protopterus annectens]